MIIQWIKQKLGITKLQVQNAHLTKEISELRQIIKDRTDVHLDVHYASRSHVILTGRYKNKDYVQCYNITDGDFTHLVEHCRELEKYGHMARVDSPPQMRAVFKHEFA